MLLMLGGETLSARAWRIACEAFGRDNAVTASPAADQHGPLGEELERIQARTNWYDGDEADVLGRFHSVAHTYRWHPDAVIVRYTPDDPWKDVGSLRAVASGVRGVVELGGEAFTLSQLDAAYHRLMSYEEAPAREHITHAFFEYPAPEIAVEYLYGRGLACLTIDTEADYRAAVAHLAKQ